MDLVNPNVTEAEAWAFIRVCATHRLSPFADGEIHLIKHSNQAAYWVIGKQAYVNRGTAHREYKGHKDGVITTDEGGNVHYLRGQFVLPGHELVGAWCEIERKTQGTIYESYGLQEWASKHKYDDNQGRWKKGDFMAVWGENAPMMIVKTAVKQTFRVAFPDVFGTASGEPDEGVVEVSAASVDAPTRAALQEADLHAGDDLFPQKCRNCGVEATVTDTGEIVCTGDCGVVYGPPPQEAPPEESAAESPVYGPEDTVVGPASEESDIDGPKDEEAAPAQNPKMGSPSVFWGAIAKLDHDGKGNPPSNSQVSKALGADPIVYMRDQSWGPENWDILYDEVVALLRTKE